MAGLFCGVVLSIRTRRGMQKNEAGPDPAPDPAETWIERIRAPLREMPRVERR